MRELPRFLHVGVARSQDGVEFCQFPPWRAEKVVSDLAPVEGRDSRLCSRFGHTKFIRRFSSLLGQHALFS